MKMKLLTFTAIVAGILAIGSAANAATCEGGTLETGENGHVYCRSNRDMNWWSANAWCEAQGSHLATIYEICPTWDGSTGSYKACNTSSFSDRRTSWSSTASGTDSAFTSDDQDIFARTRTGQRLALCY